MEKFKAYLKMLLYISCIVCLFASFLQFIGVYDSFGENWGSFLLILALPLLFIGCYYFIYLLHGQITYLDYLFENDVVVVKRKGVKYLGNLKNSDLVVSIFKSGELKFLDVVPVDVIKDMSKMMDKLILKAHA